MRFLYRLCVFGLSVLVVGCGSLSSSKNGGSGWAGYTQTGEASFYGEKHQFRRTASGVLFDQNLKTAAHKKLPFGSQVKVTNVQNGKSVVVEINDRGPFVRGRVIDLSKSAFARIANTAEGVIPVHIEVLD